MKGDNSMKLLLIFIVLNVFNVILQTIKSIMTVKGSKIGAAVINAVAYGLYTIVIVYTVCELPLWQKALIVAAANFIGVYVVKMIEERRRRTKLWKIEATVKNSGVAQKIENLLTSMNIPYNIVRTDGAHHIIFNIYAYTENESAYIIDTLKKNKAKFFISESRV